MTFHPIRTTCDRLDVACACEVFVAASDTSGGLMYADGRDHMRNTLASLPDTEDEAVTAAAAIRLIQAGADLHPNGAKHFLAFAVMDHLVECRLTPGGQYRMWAATRDPGPDPRTDEEIARNEAWRAKQAAEDRAISAEAVDLIRCPDCKAEPGQRCVWRAGAGGDWTHAGRRHRTPMAKAARARSRAEWEARTAL